LAYLLLYVDDIILTASSTGLLQHITDQLDGIRSIENKNFPTARTNNKPRSNLVDGSNKKNMRLILEDFQSLRD
jgi:hypothetical protein